MGTPWITRTENHKILKKSQKSCVGWLWWLIESGLAVRMRSVTPVISRENNGRYIVGNMVNQRLSNKERYDRTTGVRAYIWLTKVFLHGCEVQPSSTTRRRERLGGKESPLGNQPVQMRYVGRWVESDKRNLWASVILGRDQRGI